MRDMSTPKPSHALDVLKDINPDVLFAIFDSSTVSKPPVAPKDTTDRNKNGNKHRKSRSLVGFDPFLSTSEDASRVWRQKSPSAHPLLMKKYGEPPAGLSHRTSRSVCVSDLREIASQLARDKPTKEEEFRITLGDTADDSIAKQEKKLLKKKALHKVHSMTSVTEILSIPHRWNPAKTTPTSSRPGTEITEKVHGATTPTRGSTPTHWPKLPRSTIASKLSPHRRKSPTEDLDIPRLTKLSPTSFLKDAATMAYRTSEQDPSPHQVVIPTSKELLEHSKLCALLESYRKLGDQNFDFNSLKGISSLTLKAFVSLDNQSIPGLTLEQKPVIQAFLECADDIQVEGLFTHGEDDDQSQVGVFSTQSSSRFIVVYRGTTEQQLKPTRSKHSAVNLDPENPVSVYPPFRDAYFELETQVYGLLDTLVETNPFCDVVFTGHSFGGALATTGAVRFASARPMLRFFCHTFGSPKVGAHNFRQMVNTLPNLKVMRVEYGSDPNASGPIDVGSCKWEHVGHTLAIQGGKATAYRFDNKKPASIGFLNTRKPDIQAYVRAMEPFVTSKLPWVSLYAGEDVGEGVRGKNNEERLIS